jgi:hypothetical protein
MRTSALRRLLTAYCRLLSADCFLPIAYCGHSPPWPCNWALTRLSRRSRRLPIERKDFLCPDVTSHD